MADGYVDTLMVKDLLDDQFGLCGWSNKYLELSDGAVCCNLKISTSDVAAFSQGVARECVLPEQFDPFKGAYDEALKRAAVRLGDLLSVPAIYYRGLLDFPGYAVGDDGSVWSQYQQGRWFQFSEEWRRLRTPLAQGYAQVNFSRLGVKQHFKVHQLVLLAFVGPMPDGLCVRHLNGDSSDNRLTNLAYGTYKENGEDAVRHGRSNRGERCPHAKINEGLVREIRRRHAAGEVIGQIADDVGCSYGIAYAVVRRDTWAHVVD